MHFLHETTLCIGADSTHVFLLDPEDAPTLDPTGVREALDTVLVAELDRARAAWTRAPTCEGSRSFVAFFVTIERLANEPDVVTYSLDLQVGLHRDRAHLARYAELPELLYYELGIDYVDAADVDALLERITRFAELSAFELGVAWNEDNPRVTSWFTRQHAHAIRKAAECEQALAIQSSDGGPRRPSTWTLLHCRVHGLR